MKGSVKRLMVCFLSLIMALNVMYIKPSAVYSVTESQVVNYLKSLVGNPNNYKGLCLTFVNDCWVNMGFAGKTNMIDAKHCADAYIVSTSRTNIPIGADVFFIICL